MSRNLLLFKKETSYGEDAEAAAANTLWAESVRFTLNGTEVKSDPAKPGVGGVPSQIHGEHVELSFDVPLAASGTAGTAPKWGPLMLACGWSEAIVAATSVTYGLRVDPSASDSGSIIWRQHGRLHRIVGARGRCGIVASEAARPMLRFTFKGLYAPVEAGASLVAADADFTGWRDAKTIAQGRTTFSFGGVPQKLRELTFDAADNVVFSDRPHQENVQLLGDRTYTGRLKATVPAIGTFNPETAWISRARLTGTLVHESTAGAIVTVSFGAQVGQPGYSEENGEDVFEQALNLIGSTLALSDDLAIVLT